MATGTFPQQRPMLTSWKEVASYLGKGVRTVQRWESDLGLPVRRPNDTARQIRVSPDALDHWLSTRWSCTRREYDKMSADQAIEIRALRKSLSELHAENERLRHELNAIRGGGGRQHSCETIILPMLFQAPLWRSATNCCTLPLFFGNAKSKS